MEITARNAPQAYWELGPYLRSAGIRQDSRNGPVLTLPGSLTLSLLAPRERVVTDPIRDANPFFHVAETVWMLGGGQGLEFITHYVKGMARYSDDDATLNGAYGHRWRKHFYYDQILRAGELLREDPLTRRAVVSMWDAEVDLGSSSKDIPCNTHIYFRGIDGKLDMTVCNRSNDIVWGMLGANVVHMTYLHEVIAALAGLSMGTYRVFTVNAHAYTANPQIEALVNATEAYDVYKYQGLTPRPMCASRDEAIRVLDGCKRAVSMPWEEKYGVPWLDEVYVPMREMYKCRKAGIQYEHHLDKINARDWAYAAREWCKRRSDNASEKS